MAECFLQCNYFQKAILDGRPKQNVNSVFSLVAVGIWMHVHCRHRSPLSRSLKMLAMWSGDSLPDVCHLRGHHLVAVLAGDGGEPAHSVQGPAHGDQVEGAALLGELHKLWPPETHKHMHVYIQMHVNTLTSTHMRDFVKEKLFLFVFC